MSATSIVMVRSDSADGAITSSPRKFGCIPADAGPEISATGPPSDRVVEDHLDIGDQASSRGTMGQDEPERPLADASDWPATIIITSGLL